MKNNQQIKNDATLLLNDLKYEEAFTKLWELGPKLFIDHIISNPLKWQTESAISFFWNSTLTTTRLKPLFENRQFVEFVAVKFKTLNLESAIVQSIYDFEPEKFVELVRSYQIFTTVRGIENLKKIEVSQNYSMHCDLWINFHEELFRISNLIKEYQDVLKQIDFLEIFNDLVVWLELKRFEMGSTQHSIQHLSEVYSFFVEVFIGSLPNRENSFDTKRVELHNFVTYDLLIKSSIKHSILNKVLSFTFDIVIFKNQFLNNYCYNQNCKIEFIGSQFYFKSEDESEFYWKLDGLRYTFASQLGLMNSGNFVLGEVEQGRMIIPGKSDYDYEINAQLAINKYALIDLISKFNLPLEKEYKNNSINLINVASALKGLSINRRFRYEVPVINFLNHGLSCSNCFKKLYHEMRQKMIYNDPLLIMPYNQLKELFKQGSAVSYFECDYILNQFGFKIKEKPLHEWYKCNYDVFIQPFLIINNHVFCPTMFFANNDFYYSFIQNQLRLFKDKASSISESKQFEDNLVKAFRDKKFNATLIGDQYCNLYNGDVDLLVKDDKVALLIQLKRTYLRVNLTDIFWEESIVVKHGRSQLSMALEDQKFIEIFKLNGLQLIPWLVTTSFEGINRKLDTIKKINYIELLNALNDPTIENLQDLIDSIVSDKNLKEWYKSISNSVDPEFAEMKRNFGFPIEAFEFDN